MAPSLEENENTLVANIQEALAIVYESRYPCSNAVKQGLDGILNNTSYHGSQDDFINQFIRPTVLLLERLKVKGFPLVKRGKVIVHLLQPPSNQMESGGMFYQVGHKTPGTLSLKFTKYHGSNTVLLQPSSIKEIDFSSAFTLQYIEKVRNKATRMGDQLMRVLLTSTENSPGVFVTKKVELKSIMPYSTGNCASDSSHPLVIETVMPKSSDVSNMRRQHLTIGNWPDESVRSGKKRSEASQQLDEHFSGTSVNNLPSPSLIQEVLDIPSTTFTGRQCKELSSFNRRTGNAAYPPLMQAVRDDQRSAVSGHQGSFPAGHHSDKQFASEGGAIPMYPPLVQAVRDNHVEPVIGHHHDEQLSGESANNPAYPPLMQAVRNDQPATDPGQQTENPSSNECKTNPDFSPFKHAFRNDSTRQVAEQKCSSRGKSYPADSSLIHAFSDHLPTSAAIRQNAVGQPQQSQSRSNQTCQPFMPVVTDNPAPSASENNATNVHLEQLEPLQHVLLSCKLLKMISRQRSWNANDQKNRFQLQEEAIDHILLSCKRSEDRSGQHRPNEGRSSPAYPSIIQAVRDDDIKRAMQKTIYKLKKFFSFL